MTTWTGAVLALPCNRLNGAQPDLFKNLLTDGCHVMKDCSNRIEAQQNCAHAVKTLMKMKLTLSSAIKTHIPMHP